MCKMECTFLVLNSKEKRVQHISRVQMVINDDFGRESGAVKLESLRIEAA